MFNFNKSVYNEIDLGFYSYGSSVYHDFNYNIVVKINNGPTKKFFYKDGKNDESDRKEFVRNKVKEYIYKIYERDCDINIRELENSKENNLKLEGDELKLSHNKEFILT